MNRTLAGALAVTLAGGMAPAMAADSAAPAAPDTQVIVHVDVLGVRSDALHGSERMSNEALQHIIRGGQAHVIQSMEFLTLVGSEGVMLIGHKDPIIYYDPRAQQFQIQYVDTGLKLRVKPQNAVGDTLDLDVSPDLSGLQQKRTYGTQPEGTSFPQTYDMQANTHIDGVRFGDVAVVASSQGPMVSQLWPQATPGSEIVVAVSIQRL